LTVFGARHADGSKLGRIAFVAQVDGSTRNQGVFTADADGVAVIAMGCGNGGGSGSTDGCGDPTPNAILRMERPRSNFAACATVAQLASSFNWSPLVLFDPREGELRDNRTNTGNAAANEPARFGGIMHYIELDARNLSRWFRGVMPAAVCPVGGYW